MDWLALSDEEWTAIRLSLKVSAVAMIVSLPFGLLVAYLLARGKFWGKSILNGIVH
ncbi:molybdate ABC transporter permease subunit, partial [Neorhizobium galegae]|nr:molybdate ABC transporter permease subunit [Neorhizobium galegae]